MRDAGAPTTEDAGRSEDASGPEDARGAEDAGGCVEGSECNDGDACTTDDRCTAGTCIGEVIVCDRPASHCLDEGTLRTYEARCSAGICESPPRDRFCPLGCADGACVCVPRPWETRAIDPGPPEIGAISADAIALDDAGGVHVAYTLRNAVGPFDKRVAYAYRAVDGTWSLEPIGPAVGAPVLRLDGDGSPHVIFEEFVGGWSHARPSATGWSVSPVWLPVGGVEDIRLIAVDVDADARAHGLTLRGARWPGYVVWDAEAAMSSEDPAMAYWWPQAIRVDSADDLHALYWSNTNVAGDPSRYALRYARRTAAGWTARTVVSAYPDITWEARLALHAGRVHVAYSRLADGPSRPLHYAVLSPRGTAIAIETIAENAGTLGALAVDLIGGVHVSYELPSRLEPRVGYAYRDPGSGTWSVDPVRVPSDSPGTGSSLTTDSDGGVLLVYSRNLLPLGYAFRRDCH